MYYTFDTSLGSAQRADVNQAIEHWEDATMLRFYARSTGARIVFRTKDPNCFSGVGYPGSNKIVYTNIGAGCGVAATIHEIGHAVALNHEQSRCDRDNFVGVYSGRAEADTKFNFEKYCSTGAQQSTYDPYSIMHYAKWAFSTNRSACINGNDSACTILPKSGSGIDKNRMGESTRLTSRDVSGIFSYYRDQSPCDGDPNGCTWRGFTVSGTRGGSYDFTLSSSGSRAMVIQGGQTKVVAGLNKRKADGTYQNLQYKIIATDGVQKFESGTLAPGTYQWYVHADGSGSGSVDMFVATR